jgi:trehalose 6-phosphate synthase/phosphatase
MMVTPLRDGMNLVAKEYLATCFDHKGVLILSELAGAAKELHQSITVNPFDLKKLADSILEAINMTPEEQIERNTELRERIKRYDVAFWSHSFLERLNDLPKETKLNKSVPVDATIEQTLVSAYQKASKKLFLLDYDGTLVKFHKMRNKALPPEEVNQLIDQLSDDPSNHVVIISGRPMSFLSSVFSKKNITLVAEHGHFIKNKNNNEWIDKNPSNNDWMNYIHPVLQQFTDNTPGTLIEEKKKSLVWHYRKTDPELGIIKSEELKTVLSSMITNEISIVNGDKVIEIIPSRVNKGVAALELYSNDLYDFVFVAGDDLTDEDMFQKLPPEVFSIKVGHKQTSAQFSVNGYRELLSVLNKLNNNLVL